MVREIVKLIDGTEKEIEIKPIGGLSADMILNKHLKINSIKNTGEDSEINLAGSSLLLIRGEFLRRGITDVDPDMIEAEDLHRIYQKYYEKFLTLAMKGMGGNPN